VRHRSTVLVDGIEDAGAAAVLGVTVAPVVSG